MNELGLLHVLRKAHYRAKRFQKGNEKYQETTSFVPTGRGVTAAAAGWGLTPMQAVMRTMLGNVTIPSYCDVGLISIIREAEATQRA